MMAPSLSQAEVSGRYEITVSGCARGSVANPYNRALISQSRTADTQIDTDTHADTEAGKSIHPHDDSTGHVHSHVIPLQGII